LDVSYNHFTRTLGNIYATIWLNDNAVFGLDQKLIPYRFLTLLFVFKFMLL